MSSTPRTEPIPSDFRLFRPPQAAQQAPDLPESYFTPTAADLKAAQHTLAARTQALTNAPLQLRAVRDAEAQAKRDRWPEVRIRIKFTDRTQLEKLFPASAKIRAVYAFVRSCLRDDVKPIKFVLYQAPRRDLKVSDPAVREQTLAQLGLVPASVLLLRFESADVPGGVEHMNDIDAPAPLSDFVLSHAVELPVPAPPADPEPEPPKKPASAGAGTGAGAGSGKGKGTASAGAEAKMAKWLKLKK